MLIITTQMLVVTHDIQIYTVYTDTW